MTRRTVARLIRLAVLTVFAVGAATGDATAATRWHDGPCTKAEADSTTIVVEFARLDGHGGVAAPAITRCSRPKPGAGKRTGVVALRDAGLRVAGVKRWTDDAEDVAFVCRIDGRPSADEELDGVESTPYVEACRDTPPSAAYWSYWTAPRVGAAFEYSSLGPDARYVQAGGVEGWRFAWGDAEGAKPTPPHTTTAVPAPVVPDLGPRPGKIEVAPVQARPSKAGPERGPSAAPLPTSGGAASAATGGAPRTVLAPARWLVGELGTRGVLPGPGGGDDWGLTIDAVIALSAVGGSDADVARSLDALGDAAPAIVDGSAGGDGLAPKLLVGVLAAGEDPGGFGGVDLRARTLELVRSEALDGTFAQSFAVIGLARTGGAPERAVRRLLEQQCADGWFRVEARGDEACDAAADASDVDATAMAIQALAAVRADGDDSADAPLGRALAWLVRAQRPDGSFGGGARTEGANANSTGLAAQALAVDLERTSAQRARARRWLLSLVLGRSTADTTLRGAIAYDLTAHRTPTGVAGRDQWRRATTQALLGLASEPAPLSTLGGNASARAAAGAAATSLDAEQASTRDRASSSETATASTLALVSILGGMLLAVLVIWLRRRRDGGMQE